jgi:hypothetical protein
VKKSIEFDRDPDRFDNLQRIINPTKLVDFGSEGNKLLMTQTFQYSYDLINEAKTQSVHSKVDVLENNCKEISNLLKERNSTSTYLNQRLQNSSIRQKRQSAVIDQTSEVKGALYKGKINLCEKVTIFNHY